MIMSPAIIALTLIMFGGGGFMMGQALGETWRPWWHIVPYAALLAIGNQFLGFALFQGPFMVDSLVSTNSQPFGLALLAYLIEFAVIAAFAAFSFRMTQARKMTTQYPWLYERSGPFAWREKNSGNSGA